MKKYNLDEFEFSQRYSFSLFVSCILALSFVYSIIPFCHPEKLTLLNPNCPAKYWFYLVATGNLYLLPPSHPWDIFVWDWTNYLFILYLILLFLSSYLFFWDKIERSHYWLNNIVTTAKQGEELDGRLVSFLLKVRTTYLFFYRVLGFFIRIPWKIYLMHETRVCSIFAFLFLWDTKVEPTIV